MALEDGTIKRPEERKPWGINIDKYSTLKARQSLAEALRIFAPHSTSQLFADPALNIDVRRRANPHIEEAVKGIIGQTLNSFSDRGILTKDPLLQIVDVQSAMVAKYPETANFGEPMGEAFILNEVRGRLTHFLLAVIALNEPAHRAKRHKEIPKVPKGYRVDPRSIESVPTHAGFFRLIDDPDSMMNYQGIDEGSWKMMNDIRSSYIVLRSICKPFFRGDIGTFNNPENKSRDELKRENDKIGPAVLARRKREIPLCTLEDEDLFADKPTVLQFAAIEPSLNTFHSWLADVHLFEKGLGGMVADDPKIQSLLRTKGTTVQDFSLQIGNLPQLGVDRFYGDLTSFSIAPETLKLIAGNTPNYELTRRRVLWYLAQLTCHQADVEEIFGIHFEKRKNGPRNNDSSASPRPSPNPGIPKPSAAIHRTYPTERVAQAVKDNVETVSRRRTGRSGHTRLLPLIRKSNGDVVICKPSERAKILAANNQIQLENGLEILSTGEVIYPEKMEKFLTTLGAASIEEAISLDPDNISVRHETWIEGFQNEVDDVAQSVHAHVRSTV